MQNFIRTSFFTVLQCFILSCFLLCFELQAKSTQEKLNQQQLSAVISVITTYLLSDNVIKLSLNEYNDSEFSTSNSFDLEFSEQTENVELCFFVNAVQTTESLDISVILNGENLGFVTQGENCFSINLSQQKVVNSFKIVVNNPDLQISVNGLSLNYQKPTTYGLVNLTRSNWDERAVRKVLKVFAFGGHVFDSQILEWANMRPNDAIKEMLNFSEHNPKLSPIFPGDKYTETAQAHGTLEAFQNFLSSPYSNHPIPEDKRGQYGLDGYNFDDGFNRMITVRGMNPFRQKIGFWETNYHLAVNLDASVSRRQMAKYYDDIMKAHEAGLPYYEVMAVAAKSAAVAMQYGHRRNEWNEDTQECECNEDFAREIHQLYYGIFGAGDPNHEDVTIPETAKMLTDMEVPYIEDFGFDVQVHFEIDDHYPGAVTIFGQAISGFDASAKIDNLMPISMQHAESMENLPIMIINTLADDNLSEENKNQLRESWAQMGVTRNFLEFIHNYAISDLFHNANQIKYMTSHERALYMANKHNLENIEAYFGGASYDGGRAGRTIGSVISDDDAGEFFRPLHNVFGGQTSQEASDSALAFEKNYNRLTDDEYQLRSAIGCDMCDLGQPWVKRWHDVLPQREDGQYYVADVAVWLWNHAVGNMDNYTDLERAHLYSLLGAARVNPGANSDGDHAFDFNLVMCVVTDYQVQENATDAPIIDILTNNTWDDYCRDDADDEYDAHELAQLNASYTGVQIANSSLMQGILNDLGNQTLPLTVSGSEHNDDGADLRKHARERVSNALGFIYTTPFVFAEGGQ